MVEYSPRTKTKPKRAGKAGKGARGKGAGNTTRVYAGMTTGRRAPVLEPIQPPSLPPSAGGSSGLAPRVQSAHAGGDADAGHKAKGEWSEDTSDDPPPDIEYTNAMLPLIKAPAGCSLAVCNYLILIPPSVENQKASPFEQYTCRLCRKTYEGRNARSVARRHLQDKHQVPLSRQQRRTRWDTGEYRKRVRARAFGELIARRAAEE
jgi:hypothetical protein